jgi:F-type H+-transporting ATPase subunit gamma
MPSLKVIRKRIASVKNTQKITKAMKLVAAARLRRAQEAIIAARPYSSELERVLADLARLAGRDAHPLLVEREPKRAEVLVMTSDRGLAGSFNAALIRQAERFFRSDLAELDKFEIRVAGRKGRDYFRRSSIEIVEFVPAPDGAAALGFSREMANKLVAGYIEEKVDQVFLVYNEFRAPGSQSVTVKRLLPIVPAAGEEETASSDFVYEPSKEALLEHLLPLYLQNSLYRAALESIASELGARMAAMDAATRNAGQMIDRLTLQYNRARQAAITKELLEIIAGAEALKG